MTYAHPTRLIHGRSKTSKWDYNHHVVPPVSSSTTYRLDSASRGAQGFVEFANKKIAGTHAPIYIYDRLDEPTRGMLEDALALAEEAEAAVAFGSGMAAIAAALGVTARAGDRIVSHHLVYGCTYSLLSNWMPRLGVAVDFIDVADLDELERTITDDTRVVFFETPVNPTLDVLPIRAIHGLVKRINGTRVDAEKIEIVVDSTFATPFCQRPLSLGADLVVHSLTKGIGGFGTDMGGAIMTKERYVDSLLLYRKDFGGVLCPKSAWAILVNGISTLALRMRKQQESALRVAEFLKEHDKIDRVSYPGLHDDPCYELARDQMVDYDGHFAPGSMLYFELAGSPDEARARCEQLCDELAANSYTITMAVSLGQIRTLLESPDLMSHSVFPDEVRERCGLGHGGVRLSIGCEEPQDILHDLAAALRQI